MPGRFRRFVEKFKEKFGRKTAKNSSKKATSGAEISGEWKKLQDKIVLGLDKSRAASISYSLSDLKFAGIGSEFVKHGETEKALLVVELAEKCGKYLDAFFILEGFGDKQVLLNLAKNALNNGSYKDAARIVKRLNNIPEFKKMQRILAKKKNYSAAGRISLIFGDSQTALGFAVKALKAGDIQNSLGLIVDIKTPDANDFLEKSGPSFEGKNLLAFGKAYAELKIVNPAVRVAERLKAEGFFADAAKIYLELYDTYSARRIAEEAFREKDFVNSAKIFYLLEDKRNLDRVYNELAILGRHEDADKVLDFIISLGKIWR